MRVIWKFPIPRAPEFTIKMDPFGQMLCCQMQGNQPMLWVVVNDEMQTRTRHFKIIGTGHEMPNRALQYIDTFQEDGGQFVWHLFEDVTDAPSLTEALMSLAGAKIPE